MCVVCVCGGCVCISGVYAGCVSDACGGVRVCMLEVEVKTYIKIERVFSGLFARQLYPWTT